MKIAILLAVITACLATSYDGYKVLRVTPGTKEGAERLQALLESPEVKIWKEQNGKQKSIDVMVSPQFYNTFLRELEKQIHTKAYLLINDVQSLIDEQMIDNDMAKSMSTKVDPFHHIDNTFYRTLEEIYAVLDDMALEYSNVMSTYSIGTTLEGRDLKVMKVSSGGGDTKPIVWIDCGIHAREWITPASCLVYLDALTEYGTDPDVTALIDTFDFYVLTVVNPDGYSYTWSDDRLWRKNRVSYGGLCFGTDLNRNFETGFGGAGSSNQPCSDTYHGPTAFSELETQAIRDEILRLTPRILQYYNMHSYSQLWMYPYGYTLDLPATSAELDRVAKIGVDALTAYNGTQFQYGPISTTIYLASGGSVDWVYTPVGIPYSYTLELRDQGEYGFLLPAEQIVPAATESWVGLQAAINAAPLRK